MESTNENLRVANWSRRTSDPRSRRSRTQERRPGRACRCGSSTMSSRAHQESTDGAVRRSSGSDRASSTHECGERGHATSRAAGTSPSTAATAATTAESVQCRSRGMSGEYDIQSLDGSVCLQNRGSGKISHRHGITSRETWTSRQSFVCASGYLRPIQETLCLALEKSTARRILHASS